MYLNHIGYDIWGEKRMQNNIQTFSKMGKSYQEKVVQALFQDNKFAEQMIDVLNPMFFELKYLQDISLKLFGYKEKYKTFPSTELIETIITKSEQVDDIISMQVSDYFKRIEKNPLNGDLRYIQDTSLDFCKKQAVKEAMMMAIDKIAEEDTDYGSIEKIMKDALNRGISRDLGHDYINSFLIRSKKNIRKPLSTGWPVVDRTLNGGYERGTLSTFIAPTGAGKSMFLVNAGAAAIKNGYNVLYITCEMADFKIGIRFDSYFTGVDINNVPNEISKIETVVKKDVRGNLFIKEFPTKRATVSNIRSYIQRLIAIKNFTPDFIIIDYADLLKGSRGYGEKRHELESIYEDLRGLGQELNAVVITADQTNRGGLNSEIIQISEISESYAKATVCDLIMTISRLPQDKVANTGRLYIAKSRLGPDGIVFPFLLNTATVKVSILEQHEDPIEAFASEKNLQQHITDRFYSLNKKG